MYGVNRAFRAGELDSQLQEAKNALDQMIDKSRKSECENVRLNEKASNAVAELTRLRPLEGQLQYAKEQGKQVSSDSFDLLRGGGGLRPSDDRLCEKRQSKALADLAEQSMADL